MTLDPENLEYTAGVCRGEESPPDAERCGVCLLCELEDAASLAAQATKERAALGQLREEINGGGKLHFIRLRCNQIIDAALADA